MARVTPRVGWAKAHRRHASCRCGAHHRADASLPDAVASDADRGPRWALLAQASPLLTLTLVGSLRTLRRAASHPSPQPGAAAAPAAPRQHVAIGFVEIEGDPRYEPVRAYERLILKTREHPFAGAQIGVDEAAALVRVLNTEFTLERITVKSRRRGRARRDGRRWRRSKIALLPDRCAGRSVQAAGGGRQGPRRAAVQRHRRPTTACAATCARREFVHVIPSLAMRMDALMQYLVSRKWRDILVFEGPLPADAAAVKAFDPFGAEIRRPASSPTSISSPAPIRASASRTIRCCSPPSAAITMPCSSPTMPSISSARCPITRCCRARWSAASISSRSRGTGPGSTTAPRRSIRASTRSSGGRHMESADWAAWVAVKMIVQSVLRTRSTDFAKQRDFILGDAGFDGDKGLPVSVRPWDHQVRQAVLLAAPYQVVASAPARRLPAPHQRARHARRRRARNRLPSQQVDQPPCRSLMSAAPSRRSPCGRSPSSPSSAGGCCRPWCGR